MRSESARDGLTGSIATLHRGLRWAVVGLTAVAGAGLATGVTAVTRVAPTWPEIYPYTVVGVLLLLAGMWLLDLGGRLRTRLGRGLAVTMGAVAAGVDAAVGVGLLPSSDTTTGQPTTWVTALPSAAAVCLAASIAMVDLGGTTTARVRFWLAAVAGLVPLLGVLSYLYRSVELFHALGVTGTSLPASVLGVLVAGASMTARPEQVPLAALADRYDAGLIRRVLPLMVALPLVPPVVGWLVSAGGRTDAASAAVAQLVTAAIMVAVVAVAGGGQSRIRRQRAAERADLWAAFAHAPSATALVSAAGAVLMANPALARLTASAADGLLGRELLDLVDPLDRDRAGALLTGVAERGRGYVADDVRLLRPDGSVVWVEMAAAGVHSQGTRPTYLVLQCADLTRRKATERELTTLALTDPLTGLANREGMSRRLGHLVERLDDGEVVGLVFADVDGLKPLNDALGHRCGDELLREVGSRLTRASRSEDVVARLGGDEFVVATSMPDDPARLDAVIERLRTALEQDATLADRSVPVRVSLGGVRWRPAEEGLDTALAAADGAMYADKQRRRSHAT